MSDQLDAYRAQVAHDAGLAWAEGEEAARQADVADLDQRIVTERQARVDRDDDLGSEVGELRARVAVAEARRGARVPYDPRSPWNTPIPTTAQPIAASSTYVAAIADNAGKALTSDVDQYSIPVYLVDGTTPMVPVTGTGFFSSYDAGDNSRVGHGQRWRVLAPIPAAARAGFGTDAQIILWDPDAGIEYDFWQLAPDPTDGWKATNGSRTHTTPGYMGRYHDGKAGRGAGTTYLAGLVRAWEVNRGLIEHALAFAYQWPAKAFVYPASKSDGKGVLDVDAPEGSRLQLDPTKTDADLDTLGLHPSAKVICRALQTYGAYVVDNSGSSKLVMEARHTAGWGDEFTRDMLSAVPWSWFRFVAPPAPPT